MPIDYREVAFEDAIENHLLESAGFVGGDPRTFDRERAIDPAVFIPFVQESQAETWDGLKNG